MSVDIHNSEGYVDPTAFEALSGIEHEEQKVLRTFRPIVYICSPYAGDIETNTAFAKKACWYAIHQGHTPIAVHLLYPQMLDDAEPTEREIGLRLGHRVLEVCDELWLCGGRVSSGMAREIEEAQRLGIPIRQIGELEIKQEALPAEMEQSEAPGQSMGMA